MARGLRFLGGERGRHLSLTAVPQSEDKSPRKYRISEDGTERHGNLPVVWPAPSSDLAQPC